MGVLKLVWGDQAEKLIEEEFWQSDQLNEHSARFLKEALDIEASEATTQQIKSANYLVRRFEYQYDDLIKFTQIKDKTMEKILNILDLPVNVDTAGLAEWGILDSPYQERDVKLKNFNEGEYFRMALYRVLQHIYETPDFSIDPDDEQKHDDDEPPLDWSVYHPEGL